MGETYTKGYEAHVTDRGDRTKGTAVLPDEVYEDQRAYDGEVIRVCHRGKFKFAVLRGDLYGLGTPGQGDPIVELCRHI